MFVETGVFADFVEDLKGVAGCVCWGSFGGCGGGFEEGGKFGIVARCDQAKGFHAYFAGGKFVGIAEVDYGVSKAGCETGKHRVGVWGVFGSTFEEEVCCYLLPVVGMVDQLIFEEVDPCSLVFTLAKKVPVVVEGDLARRIFPAFMTL